MKNFKHTEQVNIQTTDIREAVLLKLSQELRFPIGTIRAVIDNQFKTAEKALEACLSVEISGFGKFLVKEKLVILKRTNYQGALDRYKGLLERGEELTEMRTEGLISRVASLEKAIIYLSKKENEFKKRLNTIKSNNRGVEK